MVAVPVSLRRSHYGIRAASCPCRSYSAHLQTGAQCSHGNQDRRHRRPAFLLGVLPVQDAQPLRHSGPDVQGWTLTEPESGLFLLRWDVSIRPRSGRSIGILPVQMVCRSGGRAQVADDYGPTRVLLRIGESMKADDAEESVQFQWRTERSRGRRAGCERDRRS